jgi:endonuclease/exonuclease/phosphatase family metal-dependent hydrolase
MRKLPTRVLATFAGLLMVLPTAADATSRGSDRPGQPVRVLTYNIHHGAGTDGVLDLERIAKVIEDSGADLVGLQEVDNQPAWFAARLKMHYAYAANLDLPPLHPGEPRRQYGTAVLSKNPIKDFKNTLLPLYPAGEQRGLSVAAIKIRGVYLRLANTHLTSSNNAERLEQAKKVVELLDDSLLATILVGDLNARPTAPMLGTLTKVWRDTWTEVGVGPGYTIEADNPTGRIDYLLHSRKVEPLSSAVITTNGSDHLPVVATFTLR